MASRTNRIVFLSAPIHTAHPFFQQPNAMRSMNAGIEDLIRQSGVGCAFLRPAPFAINCRNWWAPQITSGDVVRWFYGSAATAPVDERDIAAVAVRALRDDDGDGLDCVLTGPHSLTQREQVAIIGEALGRPLRFEEVTPDAARRELLNTWPPPLVDMLLSAYGAAVDRPALVTSAIEEITGTPARTFREWAFEHAGDFSGPGRI
jgi:uncharacterized protein YbjT (DUF2867 family)